jgi:cation transport ATPase
MLSKVRYNGVVYFVDDKLEELRDVNNPHNSIKFDDLSENIMAHITKICEERRSKMNEERLRKAEERLKETEERIKEATRRREQNLKAQKEAKMTTILSVIGFLFVCVVALVMIGPIGLAVALLVSVVIFFASTTNKTNPRYPLNTISKYLIHILTMVLIVMAVVVFVYALGPFGILAVGSILGTIFLIYKSRKNKQ